MSFTDRSRTGVNTSRIQPGWDVYDSAGEKVGDVYQMGDTYLVVSKGLFFPKDRYVPFATVSRVEHDRVYLNVTKADLDAERWDRAPALTDMDEPRRTGRAADTQTLQLREEELRASTQPVEVGEVEVRKEVVTEQRTIDVPVTREEVVIEQRPVDRREADRFDADRIGEGETIRVPVHEEEVIVEKRPVVTEEVTIGKRQVTDTERVSDTVRREEAVLDHQGDIDVRGWDDVATSHRQDWERRYDATGQRWEEVEPYRRFGYEMARDPRFRGRRWEEIEPALRTSYPDWTRQNNYHYAESGWERFKDNVREAWYEAQRKTRAR